MPGPKATIDSMKRTALVLATHGSTRDERTNQAMFRLAERVARSSGFARVTPAFLDGQPNVLDVASELSQPQLIVVPFMTSSGYYTNVVFPRAFSRAAGLVRITPPIGVHPALAQLVGQRLDRILQLDQADPNSVVVVVGHGTRRNVNSCRTTIDLVKQLRLQRPGQRIEFAFIDQNPGLDHVTRKLRTANCIVIPFLMSLGPHTTEDVAQAFGLPSLSDMVFESEFEFPYVARPSETGGEPRMVIFDAPVGTYPLWAEHGTALAVQELDRIQSQQWESVG